MKTILEHGDYFVAHLEPGDWPVYKMLQEAIRAEITPHDEIMLRDGLPHTEQDWQRNFSSGDFEQFALFRRGVDGATEMAGFAQLEFSAPGALSPPPRFSGIYVFQNHRRHYLGDILFRARRDFLLQNSPYASAFYLVKKDNAASIRIARRNGLEEIRSPRDNGEGKLLFYLNLQKLRFPPRAAPSPPGP